MKFIVATGLLLACVSGCRGDIIASSTPIRSPDGQNWWGIDCLGHSQNACLEMAGRQCSNGYDIVDTNSHFAIEANSSTTVIGNTLVSGSHAGEMHSGSMVISCHKVVRCHDPANGVWCTVANNPFTTQPQP